MQHEKEKLRLKKAVCSSLPPRLTSTLIAWHYRIRNCRSETM